jgi:hypothetical protein
MEVEKERSTGRRASGEVEASVERGVPPGYGHGRHGAHARTPKCQDLLLAAELASRGRHGQALGRGPAQAFGQPKQAGEVGFQAVILGTWTPKQRTGPMRHGAGQDEDNLLQSLPRPKPSHLVRTAKPVLRVAIGA